MPWKNSNSTNQNNHQHIDAKDQTHLLQFTKLRPQTPMCLNSLNQNQTNRKTHPLKTLYLPKKKNQFFYRNSTENPQIKTHLHCKFSPRSMPARESIPSRALKIKDFHYVPLWKSAPNSNSIKNVVWAYSHHISVCLGFQWPMFWGLPFARLSH